MDLRSRWVCFLTILAATTTRGTRDGEAVVVDIVHPVSGTSWHHGLEVLVNVDVSAAEHVRAKPQLFVVCAAGNLEGVGVAGSGAPNCSPIASDEMHAGTIGDDPLFKRLRVKRPEFGVACHHERKPSCSGGVSEVRVWVQHYSHVRHPSSAVEPSSRAVTFVLANPRESGPSGSTVCDSASGAAVNELDSARDDTFQAQYTLAAMTQELQTRLEWTYASPSSTPPLLPLQRCSIGCAHNATSTCSAMRWESWSRSLSLEGFGQEDRAALHRALAAGHAAAAFFYESVAVVKGTSVDGQTKVGGTESYGSAEGLKPDIRSAARAAPPPVASEFDTTFGGPAGEAPSSFSLFPCTVPTSQSDDGTVALRIHFERPPAFPFGGGLRKANEATDAHQREKKKTKKKRCGRDDVDSQTHDTPELVFDGFAQANKKSSKIPRYEYLKVPVPLPPRIPGVNSLNVARKLMAPHLREACAAARLEPGWGVGDCTLDLLEQLTERIVYMCTPPAHPPHTCAARSSTTTLTNSSGGIASSGSGEDETRATSTSGGDVDLTLAKECLRLTHSQTSEESQQEHKQPEPRGRAPVRLLDVDTLEYPEDAEEHFEVIQQALRPFTSLRPGHRPHHAAGFSGPWIENAWIESAYSVKPTTSRRAKGAGDDTSAIHREKQEEAGEAGRRVLSGDSAIPPDQTPPPPPPRPRGGLASEPFKSWRVLSGVRESVSEDEETLGQSIRRTSFAPRSPAWQSWWQPPHRTSKCLRELFGPFIPVLLPWTDLWEPEMMHRLPPDLIPTLRRVLRPNVPYVTVVQHDSGLACACEASLHELFPNLMVLSAGGYGHVPVPLLKQPELRNNFRPFAPPTCSSSPPPPPKSPPSSSSSFEQETSSEAEVQQAEGVNAFLQGGCEQVEDEDHEKEEEEATEIDSLVAAAGALKVYKPSAEEAWATAMAKSAPLPLPASAAASRQVPRSHLVSYVGSANNAPADLRAHMIVVMYSVAMQLNESAVYFKGDAWRDVMADSKFSLCPRGMGRTSYHLMETLQMGLLPIHVHLEDSDFTPLAAQDSGPPPPLTQPPQPSKSSSGHSGGNDDEGDWQWEYEYGDEAWVPYEMTVFGERDSDATRSETKRSAGSSTPMPQHSPQHGSRDGDGGGIGDGPGKGPRDSSSADADAAPKAGRFDNADDAGPQSSGLGLGWSTSLSDLPSLLERLATLSASPTSPTSGGGGGESSLAAREAQVVALRASHFTTEGVLEQIRAFLTTTRVRKHFRRRRRRGRLEERWWAGHNRTATAQGGLGGEEVRVESSTERQKRPGVAAAPTSTWENAEELGTWRVSAEGSDLVCRALPVYPTVGEAALATLPPEQRAKTRPGWDHDFCLQWVDEHMW